MDHKDHPDFSDEPTAPSKSQLKRDMHDLQALGKQLIDVRGAQLEQLNLEEKLLDAVLLAQRTNSHGGLRRQIQYIGKLMRHAPHEEIAIKLQALERDGTVSTQNLHQIEHERELLIESDHNLTAWLESNPHVDRQMIRSVIRAARQELAKNAGLTPDQTPLRKHYRALFQAIKAAHAARHSPADTPDSQE